MSKYLKATSILALLALLYVACGTNGVEDSHHVSALTPVVYGEDNRLDISELDRGDMFVELVRSTAILVPKDRILNYNYSSLVQIKSKTFEKAYNFCPDERFAGQPVVGNCSAFLVSENVLVTAGHCASEKNLCKHTSFVFDYSIDSEGRDPTLVKKSSVYNCVAAYGTRDEERTDFGIIVLDRPVRDRRPLMYRHIGEVQEKTNLTLAGYPYGLPLKISGGLDSFVRSNEKGKNWFVATLDSSSGNSGSPVFNSANGIVEGVLVRGEDDYELTDQGCRRGKRCAVGECKGEEVIKSTVFAAYLPSNRYKMTGEEYTKEYSTGHVNIKVPDYPQRGYSHSFNVEEVALVSDFGIEIKALHDNPEDMFIVLESPAGEKVKFQLNHQSGLGVKTWRYGLSNEFVYGLHKFWNRLATGEWKLTIEDKMPDDVATLKSVKLIYKFTDPNYKVCDIKSLNICRQDSSSDSCVSKYCNVNLFNCLKYGGGNACYRYHRH